MTINCTKIYTKENYNEMVVDEIVLDDYLPSLWKVISNDSGNVLLKNLKGEENAVTISVNKDNCNMKFFVPDEESLNLLKEKMI